MAEKKRTREDIKRERKQQKRQSKSKLGTWIKRIVLLGVLLIVLAGLGGAGLFAYYASNAPELDEELLKDPVSAEFYDRNGELFYTHGAENRKYVEYDEIPQHMIDAILATEDVRFFEHFGMDIWRLGGAIIANIRDGFGAQGASTITQQVVKNSFLEHEKRLERKAQEAWLAIQLERKYSKEEIFEMYFNKVLMSGRNYGFATAAEEFYGKELDELTLSEMALLAGMPQSPNNYNPFTKPENAQKRRDIVLSLMVQHGKITQAEADAAKEVSVTETLLSEEDLLANATTNYPAFVSLVLDELAANGDYNALAEGIKIYTTLDPDAQKVVESVMNNDANFPTEDIKSGVAVVDTKTGEVRAIGGGRHYGGNFPLNYASNDTRPPGSTMKPIVSYGPAIEYLNWSTGQTVTDEPFTYPGSDRPVGNWDGKYLGDMTMRYALYTSRNIPAITTLQEVTGSQALQFVNKLGLTPRSGSIDLADALGAGNVPISPLKMASAYAAFGNNGVYTAPHAITKIVFRDGVTTKNYKPEPVVAMKDSTAYMITDILRDVLSSKEGASGTAARVSGVDIAGKTGTTNYADDEFSKYNLPNSAVPDAWFSGYTSDYSIAIWSGYEYRKDPITTWEERRLPQTLFKSIMADLVTQKGTPEKFQQPNSVVSATIEVGSNPLKLASEYTPANLKQTELFVRGTTPTQVSDKYEKLELNAPTNVAANYNDVAQTIEVSWAHTAPNTGRDINVSFEVSMSVDGGAATSIGTVGTNAITVPNIQTGSHYTFTVVAVAENARSEGASASITIEGPPEEPEIDIESPEDPFNFETPGNGEQGEDNEDNGQQPTQPSNPSQPSTPGTGTDEGEQGEQNNNTGSLDPS